MIRYLTIKPLILFIISFVVIVAFAYGHSATSSAPIYVQQATTSLASKMGYSFGASKCKSVSLPNARWEINCSPIDETTTLQFSVFPAIESPYDVPTSFYLIANNDEAKKSAHQDLLSLLLINTNAKS